MNVIGMILKEAGGRFENAAGSIDSDSNMFKGSSGNAISDKLGGGEQNNPIQEEGENGSTADGATEGETPDISSDSSSEVEIDTDNNDIMSDIKLKEIEGNGYDTYRQLESKPLSGRLRNLDLDPRKPNKPVTSENQSSGGGMGMGGMQGLMSQFGGGEGADSGGDMGGDMASDIDASDMADAAEGMESDERLKRIFGDNEDAIKCFAEINAIKFTYNDTAKELPDGKQKGIDDDPHYGVKAQELAQNPLTQTAVSKDPISEYLQVDTKELTMANTAIISEICKRILIIEKILGIKVV